MHTRETIKFTTTRYSRIAKKRPPIVRPMASFLSLRRSGRANRTEEWARKTCCTSPHSHFGGDCE
ncbi:hypothetical protein DPMN_080130 [Dreissena polymorpha]|uniref:Uncharacterized protein n=1 Tax=Dreissena polymorpha TaxID=45954 RepID=A0A9D3YS24_DREPO|nr:hypothetical protein DPMN_080130 [Dreissena polymorpha]